jgi:hypothetical protein
MGGDDCVDTVALEATEIVVVAALVVAATVVVDTATVVVPAAKVLVVAGAAEDEPATELVLAGAGAVMVTPTVLQMELAKATVAVKTVNKRPIPFRQPSDVL